jgi:predicted membrane protein
MTEIDLKYIEEELEIILPGYYKKSVLNYPFKKNIPELLNVPDEIIKLNRLFREKGVKKTKWPERLYIFGSKEIITIPGKDRIYFLDVNYPEESIYSIKDKPFDPNKIEKYKEYGSIKFHIEVLIAVNDVLNKD